MSKTENGKSGEAGRKAAGESDKGGKSADGTAATADYGDLGFVDAGDSEEFSSAQESAESIVTSIHKARSETASFRADMRATYPDIRQRARAIAKQVMPQFREIRQLPGGVSKPLLSDANVMDAFDILFGDGEDRPHFDTFKGLTVGWTGEVINDDYDLSPLMDALITFQLPQPRYEAIEKLFRRYARRVRRNSLIDRMERRIPAWDGKARASTILIDLMQPFDTELTRDFGFYFWLSIYCRAMYPGCNASMVLGLIGSGGNGKSYMGKIICQEMLEDPNADMVVLDWNADFNEFLRNVTGQSCIANVAEMAGFNRAEMTKIKNLTTKATDVMHYKFERSNQQARQWVMLMDGNEYKGFQRDETGNRRFYPMIVGQLPHDSRGQAQWKEDFYVTLGDEFRGEFWQIMAECRAWMAEHGMNGYNKLIAGLEKRVKAFSSDEMANDRGTVRDDDMDAYIVPALRACAVTIVSPRNPGGAGGRPSEKHGLYIKSSDIRNALHDVSRSGVRFIPAHVKTKLTARGAVYTQFGTQNGYLWHGILSEDRWTEYLDEMESKDFDHEEDSKKAVPAKAGKNGRDDF